MKNSVLLLVLTGLACAQSPSPVSPALPQSPSTPQPGGTSPAAFAPDTVVAEVDGKKYTAAQVDEMLKGFPAQYLVQVRNDPKRALSYVLLMQHLAQLAEKQQLDKQSPLKETLEFQRLQTLSQAEINQVRNFEINLNPGDEEKFYQAHPENFREAKVKVIYVAFSAVSPANADKKALTEPEAKAKIEDLKKKLDAGADFGTLAKENSDDKASAAKEGDFGTMKPNSAYPEAIKKTVFGLKPGQVSDPIRQPNGFYLIRLEALTVQPLEQVRQQIYEDLRQQRFNQYMTDTQKRFEVKVENPAFFTARGAGGAGVQTR